MSAAWATRVCPTAEGVEISRASEAARDDMRKVARAECLLVSGVAGDAYLRATRVRYNVPTHSSTAIADSPAKAP